ncbi:Thiamin-phosphate pyrophosphorylase [hydrothermal vent metagenome]|uniref:Thiamin-phosphate pyrophosphorylase n=1 Tax=hydrothermal vent metagenome TaxID=652676 RepID=A0A1W1ELK4_9ZZZZ
MTKVWRLIDANLNRLREGLRVVEDINRYIYDDKDITSRLKTLRHSLQKAYSKDRIKNRDILGDVATKTTKSELNRTSIDDIIIANFCRVSESARVLEEAFKIVDIELSQDFKLLRYEIYEIERLYHTKD